jgi:hypothetical protein
VVSKGLMTTLRTILTVVLLVAALYVAVFNWIAAFVSRANLRNGISKNYSLVPVMSFLLAGCAVFVAPSAPLWWALLIPLLDLGNLSLLRLPFLGRNDASKPGATKAN